MNNQIDNYNIKKALIFTLFSAVSFSVMALFVKFASNTTTVDKIIAFRFGISLIYALIVIGIRKILNKSISLKTNNLPLQILRSITGMIGMLFLYTSLKYILIVNANLLSMTSALFIPILGLLFFRIKVNSKHWIAITIGFIGVALILKPNHELFDIYSFLALLSGIVIAISYILTRKLSINDNHHVCMFYMFFITFIVSGTYALLTWKTPDFKTLLFLLGVGLFGSFHQDFMIRASAYAPAEITSSLLYSTLVFSIGIDWIFFKNIPNFVTWFGIILVILSSILTIFGPFIEKQKITEKNN